MTRKWGCDFPVRPGADYCRSGRGRALAARASALAYLGDDRPVEEPAGEIVVAVSDGMHTVTLA